MNNFLSWLDILTIMSFIIGVENLELNIQQNQQLDQHLNKQDEELLAKIIAQNEELLKQNQILMEKLEKSYDRNI